MDIVNPSSSVGDLPDNTRLINALIACRDTFNERNRTQVYRELLGSTLLIPIDRRLTAPEAEEDAGVHFLLARNPESGEPVMLAFTDRETMGEYKLEGTAFISVPAAELFARLSDPHAPALIVCAQEAHLPVSHAEIQHLTNGQIPPSQLQAEPDTSPGRKPIQFRALDDELPETLHQQLHATLTHRQAVAAVYVFLVREKGREPESAVAVIFSPMPNDQTMRTIVDEIIHIVTPYLSINQSLPAFPMTADDDFARDIMKVIPACYQR